MFLGTICPVKTAPETPRGPSTPALCEEVLRRKKGPLTPAEVKNVILKKYPDRNRRSVYMQVYMALSSNIAFRRMADGRGFG